MLEENFTHPFRDVSELEKKRSEIEQSDNSAAFSFPVTDGRVTEVSFSRAEALRLVESALKLRKKYDPKSTKNLNPYEIIFLDVHGADDPNVVTGQAFFRKEVDRLSVYRNAVKAKFYSDH